MIMRKSISMFIILTLTLLLIGCAHIVADVPMGNYAGAPTAHLNSWKWAIAGDLNAQMAGGINLTYASKIDGNMMLSSMWMNGVLGKLNDTVDRLNSLANSPAGQTAIRAYTGGVGLPTGVPSIGAGNSSGVDMAALQEALKAAGCPFAKNATPGEFNRTVNALGIFDAVGLLNIFGGAK